MRTNKCHEPLEARCHCKANVSAALLFSYTTNLRSLIIITCESRLYNTVSTFSARVAFFNRQARKELPFKLQAINII